MKSFLGKIILFLTLFGGGYITFFYFIDEGVKDSKYRDFTEWNEIFSANINAELLIVGSSRAWRQVDPKIMDDKLKTNTYNMGIDGYHIPMQLTKYQIYCKTNQRPKVMVYIVDHFSFDQRPDLFNKYQFAPYFHDTLLKNRLKEYEGYKWQHYNAPYFQYSGSKEVCVAGLLECFGFKKFKSDKYKGFRSKNASWEPDFENEKRANPKGKRAEVKASVLNEFSDFLKLETKRGVNVVVVYAPDYHEFQNYIINRDSVIQLYQTICDDIEIPFVDYSDHYLCYDKKYFYNPTHLNSEGANAFTQDLAEKLGTYFNE